MNKSRDDRIIHSGCNIVPFLHLLCRTQIFQNTLGAIQATTQGSAESTRLVAGSSCISSGVSSGATSTSKEA